MIYNIKAIPTTYAGVRFRSRLEARWAAFFDLCGWKWEYEPFDLEGWAPDFLLSGNGVEILVEVKPTSGIEIEEFKKAMRHDRGPSDEDRYVMCLGRSPMVEINHGFDDDVSAFAFSDDTFFSFYEGDGKIDIAICQGGVWSSLNSIEPRSWKDAYYRHPQSVPIADRFWRKAGNRVQWSTT